MTLTQKAYNNIAKNIEELRFCEQYIGYGNPILVKKTRKVLELKLMELSRELTAERHAENY